MISLYIFCQRFYNTSGCDYVIVICISRHELLYFCDSISHSLFQVNPPSLLSTLELVNALSGSSLQGESLYWWTQFCAAVAYIKTMDYPQTTGSHTHAHDS